MIVLKQDQVETIVKTMAETALKNESYFSDLDAVMGDGDFGASLAGGFGAVKNSWDSYDKSSIGSLLLNVAMSITANTGGCSGPVWGTLFMRLGMAFQNKTEVSGEEIIPALKNAMEGIMKRGGAKLGDKTLLDALDAIVKSLEQSAAEDLDTMTALERARDAAVEMKETTKDWTAMRGRQSFTGERSIGTYDPGIVAVGVMCTEIVDALKQ